MHSLGSIRARVERLAAVSLPPAEETLIVHWRLRYERCPSCGADLAAHAHEMAVAEARAHPARLVVFWTACPRCDAPLL
jgi:uncharacterized protein with PIN domain